MRPFYQCHFAFEFIIMCNLEIFNFLDRCLKSHQFQAFVIPNRQYPRVGQSVESALIALAAIFWLIGRILTIPDKKYRILTRRDKRESYLIVLQQNNV